MRRRWKVLIGAGALLFVVATAPVVAIETTCRSPIEGHDTQGYRALMQDSAWQRDEARTWLTYPEWHIVYSAESLGRHLESKPPSRYPYFRDIRGFWSGLCAMNQAAAGRVGGDTKVMLYTIGLSYSAEFLVKALYENTLGRLSEWAGGWTSADDLHSMQVQQRYAAFMHEVPWYEFPFGDALSRLWNTQEPKAKVRHWERRLALSAEYGVKAGYGSLIGWASGASLGRDERSLRFVARAEPERLARIDPRFRPAGNLGGGLIVVEAPRYAQFTELMRKLSKAPVELVEISGNDDIFVTLLVPPDADVPGPGVHLFTAPVEEPAGWRRTGLSTKVPDLLRVIRTTGAYGGKVEHVYDY